MEIGFTIGRLNCMCDRMATGRDQTATALMYQALGNQLLRDFAGNQVIGVGNVIRIIF